MRKLDEVEVNRRVRRENLRPLSPSEKVRLLLAFMKRLRRGKEKVAHMLIQVRFPLVLLLLLRHSRKLGVR